ncbi:hypothetical protein [Intestinibacillus sp. Marseille-P6563]|uniref:hypothetical protein n=1 Tax=Intestinibacillus sp. Marseille-P6563 TaxID=2364792 RepID=UPI0013DF134C|nr:hypothetical protein [Intestinibacillus sp. Marseille-P6563]
MRVMVAQLLSFAAVCPLTDRRKTGCKSELFLKNPKKYLRGFFGGASRKRRVWGGNPNKYLTGGQMSEKRNLVHWSILALHDCTLPLASVRHFFPVCINAFCKFSFAYYSSIGCRFWQATSFSVTNNLWNSFSARWSGKNFSLAYYRTWQRKNGWKVKRTIKNAATHFRSLLLYSGNLKF